MKKLVLINSYCDTIHKIDILESYINKLKEKNFDIFLYSPISLPNYIADRCDFYFKSSQNPISEEMVVFWNFFENIKFSRIWFNSSWSSLYQYKVLSNLSLIYNYDIFYFTIYDLKLTEEILEFIDTNEKSYFFKFGCFDPEDKEKYVVKNCAMQFLSLLKKDVLPFSLMLQEKELSKYDSVESYLSHISNILKIEVEENIIIEDYICTWRDFYNFSVWEDFSLFFHKDSIFSPEEPYKILFYKIKCPIEILVRIGGVDHFINLENNYKELLVDNSIEDIEIIYLDKKIDLMNLMEKNNCAYEIRQLN